MMSNKDLLDPLEEVYKKYPKWKHETDLQYHKRMVFLFYNNVRILELALNIRDRKELIALQEQEKGDCEVSTCMKKGILRKINTPYEENTFFEMILCDEHYQKHIKKEWVFDDKKMVLEHINLREMND